MTGEPRATHKRARHRGQAVRAIGALFALVSLAATGLWLVAGDEQRRADPTVRVTQSGREVLKLRRTEIERATTRSLSSRLDVVEPRRTDRRGRAVIELETDYSATARRLRTAARRGDATTAVVERPRAASVSLPLVKQRLRNNCESAALAMLLAASGQRIDQLELQRQFPRSGPLDPQTRPDGTTTWGDPTKGYVGRPEGGGASGGYGVYEGPVSALARRHGVRLTNLTRQPADRVYRTLREGRPVMAWIGLSDGPYKSWTTPGGVEFTGNFGEHTVVLTGIRSGTLTVNDPLSGQRLQWSRSQFERMWARLGDRALTL